MRRRVLVCLTLIALSACNGDRIGQPPDPSATEPSHLISDGQHSLGNPDFFFLPPMVKDPAGTPQWNAGAFNGALRPTVEICPSPSTATPDFSGPCIPTVLHAAVNLSAEQYQANWQVPTSATVYYRIAVKVGTTQLGFADVQTASNSSQLRNVSTGEYVPLVDGRTLPIKFRIERYALCAVPGDPSKPCTSGTVDLGAGGTVSGALQQGAAETGVIIPPQESLTGHEVAVTIAGCETFNPRVTDLPVFGPCVRVTIDPALTQPLEIPATVYSCEVFEQAVAAGVVGPAQAERIAMHELNEQSGVTVRALPHAHPACPTPTPHISLSPGWRETMVALAHGRVGILAKQVAAMLSPKPLYAARFIDLGGGGITIFDAPTGDVINSRSATSGARLSLAAVTTPLTTIRDFQFALPAKFDVSATPTGLEHDPGATLSVTVRVTDLGGEPVRNARISFAPSAGSSVDAGTVEHTSLDGRATVNWTLGGTPGTNTLVASGRGIAGADYNGPRDGIDPFQPSQTHWGDATDDGTPVVVRTGSMTVTAIGRDPNGTITGRLINAFTGGAIAGATVTATPAPTGMATDAIDLAPVSATTGATGSFVLTVPAGTWDVTTAATGFVSATRSGVVVAAGGTTALGTLSAAPVTSEGNIRIVLDWGACSSNSPPGNAPCDLDSHLLGPNATGGRFHVFYAARSFSDAASAASLDVDDVSGLGPETITLTRQTAGDYHYYVHDYSNYCCGGPVITQSSARVRVFFGSSSEPAATYYVPTTGTGALWDVFKLNGTTLTAVNVITTVANPGLVGSATFSRMSTPGATKSSSDTPSTESDAQRIASDVAGAAKTP